VANQRELDQLIALIEHDQGQVQRQLDQLIALIEHDQGQVQRQVDSLIVLVEWYPLADEGRVFGPALAVLGM
jgi:hypothetical protein